MLGLDLVLASGMNHDEPSVRKNNGIGLGKEATEVGSEVLCIRIGMLLRRRMSQEDASPPLVLCLVSVELQDQQV